MTTSEGKPAKKATAKKTTTKKTTAKRGRGGVHHPGPPTVDANDVVTFHCIGVGCDYETDSPSELQRHTIDHMAVMDDAIVLSGGSVEVNLTMDIARAVTPQDAVNQVIAHITRDGLENMYFRVTADEEVFMVQSGRVVTEDEMSIRLGSRS